MLVKYTLKNGKILRNFQSRKMWKVCYLSKNWKEIKQLIKKQDQENKDKTLKIQKDQECK